MLLAMKFDDLLLVLQFVLHGGVAGGNGFDEAMVLLTADQCDWT